MPALVLIAIAETFDIRSIFYYAIGGAAIGLFAYYGSNISVALENTTDLPPVSYGLQLVAAAGIIGGFVYWLFAGRKAGRWKNPLAAGAESSSCRARAEAAARTFPSTLQTSSRKSASRAASAASRR